MVDLQFTNSVLINIDIALRNMDAIYKEEVQALGISVLEWYILRLLYEEDGQTAGRVAQAVGRAATGFTPILNSLQNKHLIERRLHRRDRRSVQIYLTKQGRALEERVKGSADKIEHKLRKQFKDKDWESYEAVIADLQTIKSES